MLTWLQGKKTYIVAGLALLGGLGSYLGGEINGAQFAQLALDAALGSTIRAGIGKLGA